MSYSTSRSACRRAVGESLGQILPGMAVLARSPQG